MIASSSSGAQAGPESGPGKAANPPQDKPQSAPSKESGAKQENLEKAGRLKAAVSRISWPAILALTAGLAVTAGVWLLVRANERRHVEKMTRLGASAIQADIESDMQTWIQGLVRLAKLWEYGETPKEWSVFASTYEQWSAFATLYIEHHPGCLAVEWLDPKYEERWLVRPKDVKPVPLAGGDHHEIFRIAQTSGQPFVSSVMISKQGRAQWLVVVPIFRQTRFRGFVLGFFDVQESLDGMLADVASLGFSAALQEEGRVIYGLPGNTATNEREWAQVAGVSLPGTAWQLRVWPRPDGLAEIQSKLPLATLFSGVLLSLLLTVAVQANHELRRGIAERRRAEHALAASQARFAGILEISAEAVISMDKDQRITLYNQAAEAVFGYSAREIMGKQLEVLIPQRFRQIHRENVAEFARSTRQNLMMGERKAVSGLRKDGREFPMAASVSKLVIDGEEIFTIICSDITHQVRAEEELRRAHDNLEVRVRERTAELESANFALQAEIAERQLAEEEVRKLSARVMRVQDEERRHLARELHDGATQNLVAISLNLGSARHGAIQDPAVQAQVEESQRLAEQCANELRTISYLLHPPLLEELGLERALRGYVEGFAKRSGVEVKLQVQPQLGNLNFEVELTVFRIVQEALANVHRHSQSRTAVVTLLHAGDNVVLEIADQGRGMPQGASHSGVGIAGMRERVRLLNGRLEITSDSSGTTVRAALPIA